MSILVGITGFVLIFLALQFALGLIMLIAPILSLRQWRKQHTSMVLRRPGAQLGVWVGLLITCTISLFLGKTLIAMLFLVCAQLFPRDQRKRMSSPEPSAIKLAGA